MRLPPPLLLALALTTAVACGDIEQAELPAGSDSLSARAAQPSLSVPPGLAWFATSSDGQRSTLWSSDPDAAVGPSGALRRTRVTVVEHAAGYAPRGRVTADGTHAAWVRVPPGPGTAGTAELFVDEVLVDDEALYLQRPTFLGDTVIYLRSHPGEPRFRPDGKLLPRLDEFELVARAPDGHSEVIRAWTTNWIQLCGTLPGVPGDTAPGLLVLDIAEDGPELRELRVDGSQRSLWRLSGADIRDVQPDPAGTRDVYVLSSTPGGRDARLVRVPFGGTGAPEVVRDGLHRGSSPRIDADGDIFTTEGLVGAEAWRVPEHAIAAGMLWREHSRDQLSWILVHPDGDRVFLAPPDDAAQDVSLLGMVR